MKIEKLTICKTEPNEEVIRSIIFKSGLNLILDDHKGNISRTGNSIGKSTVIKIIDLCLGGRNVKNLYYDKDTRSENNIIKDFLNEYKVQAELVLIDENKKYSIKRDLFDKGKRYISNKCYNERKFLDILKCKIFDLKEPKPTFRTLIPKFIRIMHASENKLIEFLWPGATNYTYDTVYSFLFKLCSDNRLLNDREEIENKLQKYEKKIKDYKKINNILSISYLKQTLEEINSELVNLCDEKKKLYDDTQKKYIYNNIKLNSDINIVKENIELLDFEISNIKKSISNFLDGKSEKNIEKILASIYEEANKFIPELQKSFEDMIEFHNAMIENRKDFIEKQLKVKEEDLKYEKLKLEELLKEQEIKDNIVDEFKIIKIIKLEREIDKLSLEKSEVSKKIEWIDKQEYIIKDLYAKLSDIQEKINDSAIKEKIDKFNKIFNKYCNRLYNETYSFNYNRNWKKEKKFPVSIDSRGVNVGIGKKKAVIAAFDLAYMQYSIDMGIKSPRFVVHDGMENTDSNQLSTIFEICKEIDGQYIMPILRERVDKVNRNFIEESTILKLSESDKFFKID